MKNKEYFTVRELADILGVSRITVFNRIKKGQIKAFKIGRNFAIPREEFEEIIGKVLTTKQKSVIDNAVKKTIQDYGQTLKLLGEE